MWMAMVFATPGLSIGIRVTARGGNRATARHRKERELQLERERPRSRDW